MGGDPTPSPEDRAFARRLAEAGEVVGGEDPARTWAGTGHLPVWLRREIEAGASLADFLVDDVRVTPAAARQARAVGEGGQGQTEERVGGNTAEASAERDR